MGEATDEELMRRYAVDGERAAYDALFRRYAGRLHSTFRGSGFDEVVADDLVQQTFLHVHRARSDFRQGARLRPWLFTIAMNVKREHWRRLKRKPESNLEDAPEPGVDPDASTAAQRAVRRALAGLPDDQRDVIVLHWYDGLPFAEIAEIVGSTEAAVKVRAHRGYKRLRDALGERG